MLTCKSCCFTTSHGCNWDHDTWPGQILADCEHGQYEPGSDEGEDDADAE